MVSYTFDALGQALYSLFVGYTFGNIYLAAGFLVVYILALAFILRVSSEGIGVIFAALMFVLSYAIFGALFTPVLVIILGIIIFMGAAKLKNRY